MHLQVISLIRIKYFSNETIIDRGVAKMVKSYKDLNIDDKKCMVEYYYNNKNKSFEEISKDLKVSRRSVSRILCEAGINTRLKNRYTLNENYFDKIDTESKAYILGFIYADGFVGDIKYNNIVVSVNDKEILDYIAKEIEFTGNIRRTNKGGFNNSKPGYSLNFSSRIMADSLRNLGLYPNKSLTLTKLPKIKNELIRHFIRGYFDGDGSIVLSHNTAYHNVGGVIKKYRYPTYIFSILGTKEFLNEINDLANFKYSKIFDTRTEEIKCLKICAKREFEYIFQYLYKDSTIKLTRKFEKWNYIRSAFVEKSAKKIG